MKKRFTKKFEDNSMESGYAFTFFCDLCGRPYHTRLLSREELVGRSRFAVRRSALALAAREAKLHFNRCTRCRRWVCDQDFDIETDLCSNCTKPDHPK